MERRWSSVSNSGGSTAYIYRYIDDSPNMDFQGLGDVGGGQVKL